MGNENRGWFLPFLKREGVHIQAHIPIPFSLVTRFKVLYFHRHLMSCIPANQFMVLVLVRQLKNLVYLLHFFLLFMCQNSEQNQLK